MPRVTRLVLGSLSVLGVCLTTPARSDDADALTLQSESAAEPAGQTPLRVALEVSVGRVDQRNDASTQDGRRVSIDLRYSTRLTEAWRLALSDRVDDTHPAPFGQGSTSNSAREAYLAWQAPGGSTTLDLGRINLRQGPAFGYNPTDHFRAGALRTITTADPVALREMRMGTVMLRLGQLWSGGGASVVLAPKLASGPDQRAGSLDLGATNARHRAMLAVDTRVSDRISGQGSVLFERGVAPKIGLGMTALAADSVVAYAEWSSGKTPGLLDQIAGSGAAPTRTQQAALGLTYTLPSALALTVEAEYNGAGLDRGGWNTLLNQDPAAYQRFAALTQPSQELGARRAWLVYASQKGLGLKQLDLTGFVRINAIDSSRLYWVELRYHWRRFDAALQWQQASGSASTEYGNLPYRQVVQLLGSLYF